MAETFSCPSCGAALEHRGSGRTIRCPYCGTVAQVPESLWQPREQAESTRQWKKWIVVFLVLTVGLPTCLGVVGTVLGIGGSIFAAIIPFVLSLFVH
ncbi:MAG: hypothetical protein V1755_00335 [Chloroflexota bacterium]